VNHYVEAFKATGVHADVAQAISWDPAYIVTAAFKKLGVAATATDIKNYILQLHGFAGANGVYDFRDGASAA